MTEYEYKYNEKGDKVEMIVKTQYNIDEYKYDYEYDKKGNIIKETVHTDLGDHFYEYDSDGNKTREYFVFPDKGYTQMLYNSFGDMILFDKNKENAQHGIKTDNATKEYTYEFVGNIVGIM